MRRMIHILPIVPLVLLWTACSILELLVPPSPTPTPALAPTATPASASALTPGPTPTPEPVAPGAPAVTPAPPPVPTPTLFLTIVITPSPKSEASPTPTALPVPGAPTSGVATATPPPSLTPMSTVTPAVFLTAIVTPSPQSGASPTPVTPPSGGGPAPVTPPTPTPSVALPPTAPALTLSSASGRVGTTVRVALDLRNVENVAGLQMQIAFDPTLARAGRLEFTGLLEGFVIVSSVDNAAGIIRLIAVRDHGMNGGTLAAIPFVIARAGTGSLGLRNVFVLDANGNPVTVGLGSGMLTGTE